jgi:drug/metabolite transporter (DMT)-like permease
MLQIPSYIYVALFVAFLWGIHPILNKILLGKFNVPTVLVLSHFVYFLAVLIFIYLNYSEIAKDIKKVNSQDILILISVSLGAGFLANLLFYYVLKSHESSLVSALVFSSPIFTLIVAYFFMKEELNNFGILGILLIVLGVVCIAYNDGNYKLENFFINN